MLGRWCNSQSLRSIQLVAMMNSSHSARGAFGGREEMEVFPMADTGAFGCINLLVDGAMPSSVIP